MMNALRILFAMLPVAAFGQAPAPFPVTIDSQRGTAPALEVFQANEIAFRVSYKSGGVANNITTETPFMYWQPFGATNSTVVTGTYSIVNASSGVVDFTFAPNNLNFAAGIYTYQAGLEQSGGPLVIKQGAFTIKPSAASIGADPIIFATTNINWGSINWSGVPDWDLITNVNAKIGAASNALNSKIDSVSNALNSRITSEVSTINSSISTTSNALNSRITSEVSTLNSTINTSSNSLQAQINAIDGAEKWSQYAATQIVDLALNDITNAGNVQVVSINNDGTTVEIPHIHGAIAGNVYIHIRNGTNSTIAKGTPICVIGNVGAGDRKLVAPAQSSDPAKMPAIAIAETDIAAGADGDGIILGELRSFDTETPAWSINSELYVATNGGLTAIRPTSGIVQSMGQVSRLDDNNGIVVIQIQGPGSPPEDFLSSTNSFLSSEFDPKWSAASNIIAGQISTLQTGKVDLAVYTPATQALWTAIGDIVSAENALTNVTGDSRITSTKTGNQVALTFDSTGLATGEPIYSLSGYLTSTSAVATYLPLAGGTMSGTLNVNEIKPSGSIGGTEGYINLSVEDEGVLEGPWRFATQPTIPGYLTTSTWALADSTTNYASQITFNATSNSLNTRLVSVEAYTSRIVAVEGYTNRAASALSSSVWASADSTTNYTLRTTFNAATNALTTNVNARLASNIWASADSTTNYQSRVEFVASSNSLNTRLVAVESYTNMAALAATTNFVTNAIAAYLPLAGGTMDGLIYMNDYSILDIGLIGEFDGGTESIDFQTGYFNGNWGFVNQPAIPGYLTSTGAAATYLPLAGGTMTGNINMSEASITNITLIGNFGSSGEYIDFEAGQIFGDSWYFESQPDIPGYVSTNMNPVYSTNLTTIAGDGLGVVSNQLVVTNAFATTNQLAAYLPLAGSSTSSPMFGIFYIDEPKFQNIGNSTFIDFGGSGEFGGAGWQFLSQPIIPGYLTTSTWASADSTTNYTSRIIFNATSNAFNSRITAVEGYTNRAALALASNVWAAADSTTNYASRFTFNATSNKFNTAVLFLQTNVVYSNSLPAQLVTTNNLSTIAGSGLGVTGNQLVVTNVAGTVTTNDLANYLPLTGGTMSGNLVAASGISTGSIIVSSRVGLFGNANGSGSIVFSRPGGAQVVNTNSLSIQPDAANTSLTITRGIGYDGAGQVIFTGLNAANLTNFPSSLLTVSAGNANYWRITTAPTGATSSGSSGQLAVSGTNIYIYSPNALGVGTARWLRVTGDAAW